jgi:hypothetical protein
VYLFLTPLVLEPGRLALRRWVKRSPPQPPTPDTEAEPTPSAVNRRVFLARASAMTAGAASVGLVGVGAVNALGPPDVLRVPVRLRALDPAFNGYRIAVVSDIHLGPLSGRAHAERIVRMINETEPDLVAIVGESRSDGPDFDRALSDLDPSRPTVLLAHQPVQVREAAARGGPATVRAHPRRPDVAVPLRRGRHPTVAGRIVDG